jgi:hypothetical protein
MSPTYRNKNGHGVTIGSTTINGGEVKKCFSFMSKKHEGIEMIDEMPMFNPTIMAEKITKSGEVKIPEEEGRFAIHFYAEKGETTIYYNSKRNVPPLKLYQGARWNERAYERLIDKLVVELSPDGILWIIVERT